MPPIVLSRHATKVSPWVTLVERVVGDAAYPDNGRAFHSLAIADYVTVLPQTDAGDILLVHQFRPALEQVTVELPGGLLEPGEDPAECASRELAEETGYQVGELLPLGVLRPDSGRLENRLWAYFARGLTAIPNWQRENEVVLRPVPKGAFLNMVRRGEFDHALHVSIVGLAILKGYL
jgi:ADP-ribose pyrophosphatase